MGSNDGGDHHSVDGDHEQKGNQPYLGGGNNSRYMLMAQATSNNVSTGLSESANYIVNYPNPFNASTTIQYELKTDATVTIEIYDLVGNRITQVTSEKEAAGVHTKLYSSDNLNNGFYFIKLRVNEESFIKRIAFVK